MGFFITFEGGEGSGKSTLLVEVKKYFESQGISVLATREPGGCELAEQIRQILLNTPSMSNESELFLFLAARAQHVQEVIKPALQEGTLVLCDRFNDSTIVYQGVARNGSIAMIEPVCKMASQGLEPHCTFLLDVAPEVGFKRIHANRKKDRIEQEALAFHAKVREGYLKRAKENPKRFFVLDAGQPKEAVARQAIQALEERFP